MPLDIVASQRIRKKIKDEHDVEMKEVGQCFHNREGGNLEDIREKHLTDPLTQWFIAETNRQRKLKIAFMLIDGKIHLKTAYEPNEIERSIYYRKYPGIDNG